MPQEFRDFLGFLSVKKILQTGVLSSSRPGYSKYGLKRDRRKLYIEPLHLPPEDGEKGRGEAVRSITNTNKTKSTTETTTAEIQLKFEEEQDEREIESNSDKVNGVRKVDVESSGRGSDKDSMNGLLAEASEGIMNMIRPVAISSFKRNKSGLEDTGNSVSAPNIRRFNLADSKARAQEKLSQGNEITITDTNHDPDGAGCGSSSKANLDF